MASAKLKPKKRSSEPHMLPNLLIFGLLRRPRNAADLVHRAYIHHYWRRCRSARDFLAVFKGFLLSPLRAARGIRAWSGRLGRSAAALSGKPLWRQRLEQFHLAFFYSLKPKDYYLQEFYLDDGMARARFYFNEKTLKAGVYRLLGSYGRHLHREAEICPLGRKLEFFNFSLRKDLNVVPVLLQFMGDGTVHDFRQNPERAGELPRQDLFCKPNLDNRGRGAEAWFWKGEQGCYVSSGGESLTAAALKKRLTGLARQHRFKSFLVQPLVLPHPELLPFRQLATPTVRIITYTDLDGRNKLDRAMLRFSTSPEAVIDNASAGGAVAPIDPQTGVLGRAAVGWPEQIGRWMSSLDKGLRIEGRRLPYWKETMELVLRAHRFFPHRLVIGWDVIITEKGPLILEGNSQPGVYFIQKAYLQPLGQTETGKAMAAHCQNAIGALYSGRLGGEDGGEEFDLFSGSRLKKRLSWLPGGNIRGVRLVISGRVQRVFYRRWLQKEARKKRLAGWVRNRHDGTVEAVLKGRAFDIEDLVRAAWFGPPRARVSSIRVSRHSGAPGEGFKILKSVKSGSGNHE